MKKKKIVMDRVKLVKEHRDLIPKLESAGMTGEAQKQRKEAKKEFGVSL